jgi:hypothetical protein
MSHFKVLKMVKHGDKKIKKLNKNNKIKFCLQVNFYVSTSCYR